MNEEKYLCEVCAKDLTDPKNAGDLDCNGNWVCASVSCRAVHDVPMTVDREVVRRTASGDKSDG